MALMSSAAVGKFASQSNLLSRGHEAVSSTGFFRETWICRTGNATRCRNVTRKVAQTARAHTPDIAGRDSWYGFGQFYEGSERSLSCGATSTANSDSLSVPGHWGLSDGVSKELVTDQELGVVYSSESASAAADHIGTTKGDEVDHRLSSGAAAGNPEVQEHTQGTTAEGFRVLDEDLAGSGGGIHDDGHKHAHAEPVPVRIQNGRNSRRLAPASLSQSMQAVSGRGLKAVVGVASPLVNPGNIKGSAGMAMAATLTVAGVVGAVSQGANLLTKAGAQAPAKVCKTCKGSGRISCDLCQGTGQIRWEGKYRHKDECPSCEGKGEAKCHCKPALSIPELAPRR